MALGKRVIVESFPDDLRGGRVITDSRVVIPSMYTESSRFSTVISIGSKARVDFKPGDTVFTGRYPVTAQSFKYEDREFVSIEDHEFMALIS